MKQFRTTRTGAAGGLFDWRHRAAQLSERHAFSPRFYAAHVWWPMAAFAALVVLAMLLHGDQWLTAHLYAWEGQRWALRDARLTQRVVHLYGRDLSTALWLGVVGAWVVARIRDDLAAWRTPLAYLALSVLLATALVAWIKSWSNMDCPWDLQAYGGTRPYVGLFALRPLGLARASCFPAGHASGGYAWMALYFFLRMTRPAWRAWGLGFGLALGLVFGISQQLRGAHFFSHDVWTAAICWFTALGLYVLFQERARRRAHDRLWADGMAGERR